MLDGYACALCLQEVLAMCKLLLVWGVQLDAPGQCRGQLPSSVWTRHRAVKQGKSGAALGQPPEGKEGRVERSDGIGGLGPERGRPPPISTPHTTSHPKVEVELRGGNWG